jgi:SAM-dependent MidA family methyltransferase
MSRIALKSVHLIENSHAMRAIQKEKLLPASKAGPWDLSWHDSLHDVPQETGDYTMLVAHEFFDALPIHVLEVNFRTVTVSPILNALHFMKCPENSARMARSPGMRRSRYSAGIATLHPLGSA